MARPAPRYAPPSARWLALPFFVLGGAIVSPVATFAFVEAFVPAGEFAEILAAGLILIATIVGVAIGLAMGIGFARGTHLR